MDTLQKAAIHLSKDPVLAAVIAVAPLPNLKPHTNYYRELASSVISQQLSVKAAVAIEKRFQDLFGGQWPSPEQLITTDTEALRGIGISYAKARYLHDLAEHMLDGRLTFNQISKQTNQEIITMLTEVKGVGEWTAHMFLIFCVGRLDVLPIGDLGVRNGIAKLYNLPAIPLPQEVAELAAARGWAPYQSVAAWYIWHSLDNKPAV